MSSPGSLGLQGLHCLDRSQPEFAAQLSKTLYGEKYKRCVPTLDDADSVWLVDYLDDVCCCVALSHLRLNQSRFSVLSVPLVPLFESVCVNSDTYAALGRSSQRRTRFRLRPNFLILVSTHSPREVSVMCTRGPSTVRGCASSVCGSTLRTRIGAPRCVTMPSLPYPPLLTEFADLLPRGRNVEALGPSEHLTPSGCYSNSPPAHFRLDARRRPAKLYQEKPQCGSTRACWCPFML